MRELTRDGTFEPMSGNQLLRDKRGEDKLFFIFTADRKENSRNLPLFWHPCMAIIIMYVYYNSVTAGFSPIL